ncbi:MAG: efflux RND transporter periplasmic adaptor subunit [Rikenellaceae bacterium]|nr:efflux RND transporter periplasmic adaptor subunit [Rikenellaceae bacterium]
MRRTLSIISILLIVACTNSESVEVDNNQLVKVAEAQSTGVVVRNFAALSTADDAVNLAFKISGRVVDIPVAKGVMVRRGEVLARLDERDVKLQVDAAKASYDEVQSRLRRAQRLAEHDAISQQEVESLISSVEQARTTYENALDLLQDTRIVAPFDGVVERTYVDAFQRVASGETIVRIVTPVSTTVGFTAPEDVVTLLAEPTTRFSVTFDAYPDVAFAAVIKSFARTTSDARGYPVSLRLVDVDTSKYRITPGMTCMATVELHSQQTGAVAVPLAAIYAPIGEGDYVWVVDDDGRVEKRSVHITTILSGNKVAVRGDISVGDRVVVAGVYRLADGERVTIME